MQHLQLPVIRHKYFLKLINWIIWLIGMWRHVFDRQQTTNQTFYTTASTTQTTLMMHQTLKIPYTHNEQYSVSVGSLEYNLTGAETGEVMEMVIILPDAIDGLIELEVWNEMTGGV